MIDSLSTPIGRLFFLAGEEGLVALGFDEALLAVQDAGAAAGSRAAGHLKQAAEQLAEYFAGRLQRFDLPLDFSALSPFQKLVYGELVKIPYGETRTYAELAARIGRPRAYRAVGRANATNPFTVVVPCHRLVGAGGDLRGYGGGLHRKEWLLAHESAGSRLE